jgi:riboflavin synthase
MFTGIVQAVGQVQSCERKGDGVRLVVDAGGLDLSDIAEGDSIAVSGCCLTVVARRGNTVAFDLSAETLRCTAGLDGTAPVNLEKALRLADRLGGHLVTGHVDGVGTVTRFEPVPGAAAGDGSYLLEVEAPHSLARYIATKGSIAIDGVSLTVNDVDGARFAINLIPHTLAVTTFGRFAPGRRVNLEVDLLARYIQRMLEVDGAQSAR